MPVTPSRSSGSAAPGAHASGRESSRAPAPGSAATRVRALVPLLAAVVLAAVLNIWALAQNGYANVYYSAGVKSMLLSWHNFFFLSADPAGLISIDKPPLGLWLQAASAELFGFSPLSLLLPEAIAGVLAVAALYLIVRKRYGTLAATRERGDARSVPRVRRGLARQQPRRAADPADDARLRHGAAGDRDRAAAHAARARRCSWRWRSTPRRSPPAW